MFKNKHNIEEDITNEGSEEEEKALPVCRGVRSLDVATFAAFSCMPCRLVNGFLDAIRVLCMHVWTWGTVFSGIDIAAEVLESLKYTWDVLYEIVFITEQTLMCENDPTKQAFLLKTNKECELLVNDVKDLTMHIVTNVRDGSRMAVPSMFNLLAGFVCSDKSSMSCNAKKMKRGMQDHVGKTSESFDDLYAFIAVALPVVVILENLKSIMNQADVDSTADSIYVLRMMAKLGYAISMHIISRAPQHGSGAERTRLYFIFIRVPLAIGNDIVQILEIKKGIRDMNSALKFQSPSAPQDFLLPMQYQEFMREPCVETAGKAVAVFKDEHFMAYGKAGMKWSANMSDAPLIDTQGMWSMLSIELTGNLKNYFLHDLIQFAYTVLHDVIQ